MSVLARTRNVRDERSGIERKFHGQRDQVARTLEYIQIKTILTSALTRSKKKSVGVLKIAPE
jgi:hypothetical protein